MIKCYFFLKLFFFLLIPVFFSCTNSAKVKVGFLLPNDINERYKREEAYFTKKIQENGGEAIVKFAGNDQKIQNEQANQMLEEGVKVLVVNSVNLNVAAAIIRDAHDRGVKVIAYDRLISNCELDYFLSFDNEKVGELMADYAVKIKPEGNYILLGGDKADRNAVWVKDGQEKVLAPLVSSGKVKIKYNVYIEDWSGDYARMEMKKYFNLSSSFPDVILSSYDGLSTSVIDLLKEYSMEGKVVITGQDAELPACQNIVKGYQGMTVYKSVKNLATKAAELSIKIVKGESIDEANQKISNGYTDVPSVLLEPVLVTRDNLKSTVIAEGYQKEEEVYRK